MVKEMYYRINFDKLNEKIEECGTTKEVIAEGISAGNKSFYKRLQTGNLLIGDMHRLRDVLHLTPAEAIDIFLGENTTSDYKILKGV